MLNSPGRGRHYDVAMNIYITAAAIASITIASPSSCTLFAQSPGQEMVSPSPLEAEHPRAKQAAALVALILKGDRAAVLNSMKAEGTAALAKNPELESVVDAQIARLANKGYAIAEFMTGRGADVIVELTATGAEPTNIVIRFTADAPHKFEGFARAMPG
jgi:hypothetical protein